MKPKLPTIPRSNLPIEALDPAWVRQLLRCVEYAMEHPKGDGFTILNSTPGILQAVVPGRQGVSSVPQETYQGDFDIEVTPATTPYTFNVKIFSSSPFGSSRAGYVQNRSGQSFHTLPVYICPTPLVAKYRYLFYLDVSFDSSDKQRISSVTPRMSVRKDTAYLAQGRAFPVLCFEISEAGKAKVLWRSGYDMPIFVENIE